MMCECSKCKGEFLSEASPYMVLPQPSGTELVCYKCYESKIEKLKAENEELKATIAIYSQEAVDDDKYTEQLRELIKVAINNFNDDEDEWTKQAKEVIG